MMMRQAFMDLKPMDGRPPEDLKEEVFNSLETLQLIADVIDLFTSQFVLSESEMMNLFDSDFHNDNDREITDENNDDTKEEDNDTKENDDDKKNNTK